MCMQPAREGTSPSDGRASPQRTSGKPMTKHDVSSRSLLVRGFGLEGIFTGRLLIGVQRLVGTQNAEGNQVAFELSLHLGVELVKVQSAFAGDLNGDDLRSHLAGLGRVVQVDVCRVDLPVTLERVFVGEGLGDQLSHALLVA